MSRSSCGWKHPNRQIDLQGSWCQWYHTATCDTVPKKLSARPLKIGLPKRKFHLPKIHFLLFLLLVAGKFKVFFPLWRQAGSSPCWQAQVLLGMNILFPNSLQVMFHINVGLSLWFEFKMMHPISGSAKSIFPSLNFCCFHAWPDKMFEWGSNRTQPKKWRVMTLK